MKQFTILFLLFASSLSAQNEFAPLGATWKYTFHTFEQDFPYDCEYNVCNQYKQRLEVIDTTTILGKKVSILRQFEEDSSFSDIPEIYIHSRNDSVFFFAFEAFHLLYDFTAEDGDTISISVPTYYDGPGSFAVSPFPGMDTIVNVDVIVENKDLVVVSGVEKRRVDYISVAPNMNFTLPNVIDGIGSGNAFFGYTGGFVSEGCYGFFICYEDENQAYTPYGCCEFPDDFPERKHAPLGAEWLYEGWSLGAPNTSGCDHACVGNYNLFRVEDEIDIAGRVHAVVRRYHRTKDTDWELTDDEIRLYDYDGGFYASQYDLYSFGETYRTDVSVGDTIFSSAAQNYPEFIGNDTYNYEFPRNGGDQVVESIDTVIIDGQSRLKITHRSLDLFRIGEVIEGIGPLFDGLLGSDIPIPASGCAPRLICYRDSTITYAPTDCGCEFPMGPNPNSVEDLPASDVTIYPNPAGEVLFIDNEKDLQFEKIRVLNIQGQCELSIPYDQAVNISTLNSGVYIVEMKGNTYKITKKLVKR